MGLEEGGTNHVLTTLDAVQVHSTHLTQDDSLRLAFVHVLLILESYSSSSIHLVAKEEHVANFGSHAKPGHCQFTLYVNRFDVAFDMQQWREGLRSR